MQQIQPPNVVIVPGSPGVAKFPTVGVTLSQLVFWTNNDQCPHHPVSPQGAFDLKEEIAPGKTSNTQAPGNAIGKLVKGGTLQQGQVFTLTYQCSLHPDEAGVLELVNDFYAPNEQISITRKKDHSFDPVALIQGGKPKYTFDVEFSELPATVQVVDGGVAGPMLTGSSELPGVFLLRMTIQDNLSNVLTDTFQITIN